MDNKDRAFAILCLDTGRFMTETLANQFHMTIEDLETELAIFRCSPVYIKQYAAYTERVKKERLKDCAFTPWRDNFTMRQLPNKRIECIVRDENAKMPFLYHAYLPGKEYLDNINDRSSWVGSEAFNYVIAYEQIGLWQSRPVDTQLRFLVMRFDAATFLPFRRTINYIEYERITGVPFPENPDDKKSRVRTPVFKTPPFFDQKIVEANELAAKTQLAELLAQRSIHFQKGNLEVEHMVSDDELESASELLELPDLERLKRLAEVGPCQAEWTLLRYLDEFYKKWGLIPLMSAAESVGNLTLFKEQVRGIWEKAFENANRQPEQQAPQTYRKRNPQQDTLGFGRVDTVPAISRPGASVLGEADADRVAQAEALLQQLQKESVSSSTRFDLEKLSRLLESVSLEQFEGVEEEFSRRIKPRLNPQLRMPLTALFERLRREKSANRELDKAPQTMSIVNSSGSMSQSLMNEQPFSMPLSQPEPEQTVLEQPRKEPSPLELMERRRELLRQLRSGLDAELVRELQESENKLLALGRAGQPAGFPERDSLLLYLYAIARIKTGAGMTQRVMIQLSDDEINDFLALQARNFR